MDELRALRRRGDLDGPGLDLRTTAVDLLDPNLDLLSLTGGACDGVLIDAPCTGLGNLGRHPELRWSTNPRDVESCARIQAQLLDRLSPVVGQGGRLVYAVCSLEPEEGPRQVRAAAQRLQRRVVEEASFTPEAHRSDGLYVARLE